MDADRFWKIIAVTRRDATRIQAIQMFNYTPGRVYDKPIEHEITQPAKPIGDKWDEDSDELSRRFPKLWAKFGE